MSNFLLSASSTDCAFHSRELSKAIAHHSRLDGCQAVVAASFIQQVHYWLEKETGKVFEDGKRWIYNSYKKWIETQFPSLSTYAFTKIKNALIELGLLECDRKLRTKWNQTYYYSLNYDRYFQLLESLQPLKSPNLRSTNNQDCDLQTIDSSTVAKSITNNTSIEKQQKENIEKADKKKVSAQEEEETGDVSVIKTDKESTNSLVNNLNSPKKTNVAQVDEKINKDSTGKLVARSTVEKPKLKKDSLESGVKSSESDRNYQLPTTNYQLKKDMHYPEGDRYFQTSSQQSEIRSRAKMDSVVGMSGLKDIEQLEECRDRLTEYYLEIYDFETAEKKVNFEIDNAVRNGRRSQLIKEFLKGEALGVAFKQEWEAKRGVLLPAFTAYLQHQLRKDGDTPEQVRVKIYWFKKDGENLRSAWAECKRIINIQKPKLKQAIQLGRDLNATDIPQWFIETFRPEIKIEEIVETAEVLGAIALNQATRTKQHQERLSGSPEDVPELEESHPIRQLLGGKGVLGVEQPSDSLKREQADSVMDRVAEDSEKPEADETPDKISTDQAREINCLLADPITRDRGVWLAKQQNLPLLLNNEGVAIGVDSLECKVVSLEFNKDSKLNEGHGAAHELYVPEQIEKGSFSAFKEAIAKSKFLKNRRKTMSE